MTIRETSRRIGSHSLPSLRPLESHARTSARDREFDRICVCGIQVGYVNSADKSIGMSGLLSWQPAEPTDVNAQNSARTAIRCLSRAAVDVDRQHRTCAMDTAPSVIVSTVPLVLPVTAVTSMFIGIAAGARRRRCEACLNP